MSLRARFLAFIMCHIGFFAMVFLLVSVQPTPGDADPATVALEQAEREAGPLLAASLR